MRALLLGIGVIFSLMGGVPGLFAQNYQSQVNDVASALERAVAEDLSQLTIGRRLRDRVANVSRIWHRDERPSGPIRAEFFDATKLLFTIADDSKLPDKEKDRLITTLVESITTSMAKLSEPFADPSDLRLLDAHFSVEGKFQKVLSAIGARILWFLAALGRDLSTGVVPATHHADGHWSLSMPRALPGLGEDSIRSKLLKRIAVDLGQNFKSAMRDPKSHQGAVKALDQLNLDVQDTVEPLRFSQIHHLTQSVYMALMIWFVMNPTPELVLERTQASGFTSSVAYMGIYSGLIYLRRVTSGMGFAASIRHIMKKAGVSSYERKATVHGIVDFLSGRPCSSSVSRIKNRWE